MSGEGYLLSEAAVRKLAEDHRRLSHQVYRLEQRLAATYNPPDWGVEHAYGVIVNRSGASHPTPPANTYTVRLSSISYDQTTIGNVTAPVDQSDPAQLVTARTIIGCNLPSGQGVELFRIPGKLGGQWYIRPFAALIRRATVKTSPITAGSSGTITLKVHGLTDEDVTGYYDWGTSGAATLAVDQEVLAWWSHERARWFIIPGGGGSAAPRSRCVICTAGSTLGYGWRDGAGALATFPWIGSDYYGNKDVKVFPTMNGTFANADGDVFEVEDSPAAYADDWLTLKQVGKYRVIAVFTVRQYGLTQSDAETYLQDPGHFHMYTSPTGPTVTGSTKAGATGLLNRLIQEVTATIGDDSGGAGVFEANIKPEAFYMGTGDGAFTLHQLTAISYIDVLSTPVHVNLQLSAVNQPYAPIAFAEVQVTVEQINDP